jgi:hypothetical protein
MLFDVLVTEWLACVFFFLLFCVPASRASEFLRDYDGSVIQMRMAYSAVAHFLVQWTDCKLAGALGLLKIMLYKVSIALHPVSWPCLIRFLRRELAVESPFLLRQVCADGSSSALPDWEREASIRQFYGN